MFEHAAVFWLPGEPAGISAIFGLSSNPDAGVLRKALHYLWSCIAQEQNVGAITPVAAILLAFK